MNDAYACSKSTGRQQLPSGKAYVDSLAKLLKKKRLAQTVGHYGMLVEPAGQEACSIVGNVSLLQHAKRFVSTL